MKTDEWGHHKADTEIPREYLHMRDYFADENWDDFCDLKKNIHI